MLKGIQKYFLFLLFLLSSQSISQITPSGFITDAVTGEALFGTNILLYKDSLNLSEPPLTGTAANSYGFYAIPKLSAGKYFLVARYVGYKTLIREIDIKEGISSQFNFELTPEEIRLEEIFVTGEKPEEPKISTIDISPDLLSKLPSLSGETEVIKSLQLLPGVQVANELSSGLYIRGGSPDQNLTLVDGTILYNPSHLGNFSSTFNSDAVQSIRLIKGAFPAEYGGRLSSVLDIRLRSGTKEKNKGIIGLGSLSSRFLLEGPLGENATYIISGRKMYYDVLQRNLLSSSITPWYNFYDLNSKISYNISSSDILWIEGFISRDHIYNPPESKEIDYGIEWQNTAITLNWLKISSRSAFLNSSISYVDYRFRSILADNTENSFASSEYFSSSILKDLFLKSSAELHLRNNQIIETGAEIAVHNYHLIYSDFYDEILESNLNSLPGIISAEAALYFKYDWEIFNNFKTNTGARFYYFKSKEYFRFEPRLSATYLLNDNFHLQAAFAVAHQFLHLIVRNDISLPTDLWYPSSKVINPGRSTQYVLGFDSYFNKQEYQFSVEGYYKWMANLYEFKTAAVFQPGEAIDELLTIGKGEAYGVEVFLNKRSGNFSGWVGYTLSWTKRKFDELNAGKVFYPRYDRRHDISLVCAYNLTDNFSFSGTWNYSTGQAYTVPLGKYQFQNIGINESTLLQIDYTDRNSYRLPSYHRLDLNFTYKFVWSGFICETYLNIYNLYNRQNPFAYYLAEDQNNETVLKQITLFPFIPTIGINFKF